MLEAAGGVVGAGYSGPMMRDTPGHKGPMNGGWAVRLAASTLGMPGAGLDEVCRVLAGGGCSGIELRAGEGQPVHVGLTRSERTAVRRKLAEARLAPLAVSSYVNICAPGDDGAVVDDVVAHADLAADLGALGVRVFPGGAGDGGDDERGRRRLAAAAEVAGRRGVRVLVETHDSHPRGADVVRLVDGVEGAGVIWDFVHPWRSGEEPKATYDAVGPWLAYVQLKDAVPPLERPVPALIGSGAVPLDAIRAVLGEHGYDGWWSVEWEKAWFPDIPPLSDALASARTWLG
ncbi:MAG TPA: sugar phosphate isomerase/epimerase [Kribbellaceae bacterium]